ncbi:MAG: hypothetical protein M3Y68_08535 [Chloroflexota bacterium]|nr:hypothetical protein [Chloroflexota bacterium]
MNTLFKLFGICAALSFLLVGCGSQPGPVAEKEAARDVQAAYRVMLGKPVTDAAVASFLTGNACSSADPFWLCRETGMALWLDANQTVETVYLYVNNSDGFEPYQGTLPFGLKFYDTMGAVEYKLERQGIGNDGRPDSGVTPDHMYYRAIYKEAGMIIVYNAPAADEDATIRAILIGE